MKALEAIWNRRTTTFGYLVVVIGVLAVSDGIFSPRTLKWIILVNGIVGACIGHYNQSQINKAAANVGPAST